MSPALLTRLLEELAEASARVAAGPVARADDPAELRAQVARAFDLERPLAPEEALARAARLLGEHGVQVTHPRYFGLFNPSVRDVAVAAEAVVAAYNPQLAAWSHAPAAVEMERHALAALARILGLPEGAAGTFTVGGAEANLQGVLCALAARAPGWARAGVAALPGPPVVYASAESHHSLVKIVRACGLGEDALRRVAVDARFALDPAALERAIAADRAAGRWPLAIVATAGTTGAGAIDPLDAIAKVASREGTWLHVDAAYGGTAALSPRLRPALAGIERADSIAWDAHKWLSVPLGAGMFFCRHPEAVARAFGVSTSYMPASGDPLQDPFTSSMQWSRRASGVKVLLALAELGLPGWAPVVERMAALGDQLRARLRAARWSIRNATPLPVVCATPPGPEDRIGPVLAEVQRGGSAWVSEVALPGGVRAVRACVTSFRTTEEDVVALVEELERARRAVA
jgi:glutamate/tyrosine decarboxylase-like PLP-dependent enzyme